MATLHAVRSRATYGTSVAFRGTGHAYATRFSVTVEGGPELSKALRALEETVRVKASKDAVAAMGDVIATEWERRLPHGPEPFHIADAVEVKTSKTKAGASGSVAIRRLSGPDSDDQPLLYARKLEHGSRDTAAVPAALPAFEAKRQEAADAGERAIRDAVMGLVR